MLILLGLTYLLLSGGPELDFVNTMSARVEQSIVEPDRKQKVLSLVNDMANEINDISKRLESSSKSIAKLNRDHSSRRESFEKALDELNQGRIRSQEKILQIRFNLKDHMTREEWEAVFEHQ
jgi:predicted  nucleic acid-binding Zn-ribbon protein